MPYVSLSTLSPGYPIPYASLSTLSPSGTQREPSQTQHEPSQTQCKAQLKWWNIVALATVMLGFALVMLIPFCLCDFSLRWSANANTVSGGTPAMIC